MTAEAKYLKVARILQKRIEDGVYKTQTPLPDQKNTCRRITSKPVNCQKSLRWITKKRSCI